MEGEMGIMEDEMGVICNMHKGYDSWDTVRMIKIKEDEMVGACSTCWGDEKFVQNFKTSTL